VILAVRMVVVPTAVAIAWLTDMAVEVAGEVKTMVGGVTLTVVTMKTVAVAVRKALGARPGGAPDQSAQG